MSADLADTVAQQFYSYRSPERKKSRLQRFLGRECANWLMATVGAFLNSRNAKLYLAFRPDSHFDFDRFPQFAEFFQFFSRGEGKANCGDLPRLYLLLLNIARVMREKVPGDLAEIGVYQGNTARILAEAARSSGRHLYLFDTFEGFHSQDLRGPDRRSRTLRRYIVGNREGFCRYPWGRIYRRTLPRIPGAAAHATAIRHCSPGLRPP